MAQIAVAQVYLTEVVPGRANHVFFVLPDPEGSQKFLVQLQQLVQINRRFGTAIFRPAPDGWYLSFPNTCSTAEIRSAFETVSRETGISVAFNPPVLYVLAWFMADPIGFINTLRGLL